MFITIDIQYFNMYIKKNICGQVTSCKLLLPDRLPGVSEHRVIFLFSLKKLTSHTRVVFFAYIYISMFMYILYACVPSVTVAVSFFFHPDRVRCWSGAAPRGCILCRLSLHLRQPPFNVDRF